MTTVTVTGKNGDNGTPGTNQPGLAGQSANAFAGTAGAEDNSATAQGGAGGEGATKKVNGKPVLAHGGIGGSASALADVDVALAPGAGDGLTPTATAMALGGAGGAGGPSNGGGDAGAFADATNTLGDATSNGTAVGGDGGFTTKGSPLAPPGAARGNITAHAAGTATAMLTATGGTGSIAASPATNGAGDGGAIGLVSAMAVGGTAASATVIATGGTGGDGEGFAPAHVATSAGNGATVSLNNRVSGSTQDGALVLTQTVYGGTGGSSLAGSGGVKAGIAGGGGSATSLLSLTDNTSATVQLNAYAHGGASGFGFPIAGRTGGNAVADSNLVAAGNAIAEAIATGGISKNHSPHDGTATATASATGSGNVEAGAQAETISGARLRAAANATATAVNLGTAGRADANATANGTGGGFGTATAIGAANGITATAVTIAPAAADIVGADSTVFAGTLEAQAGDLSGVEVSANAASGFDVSSLPANLQTVFGNPGTQILGAANLDTGVESSTFNPTVNHTYVESISWSVASASLKAGAPLAVGFADVNVNNTGFEKLLLTISENGTTVINRPFTSAAAAATYFTDNVVNLGVWKNNGSGTFTLKVQLTVTDNNQTIHGVSIDVEAGLKAPPAQFLALPSAAGLDLLDDWSATAQSALADHIGTAPDFGLAALAPLTVNAHAARDPLGGPFSEHLRFGNALPGIAAIPHHHL